MRDTEALIWSNRGSSASPSLRQAAGSKSGAHAPCCWAALPACTDSRRISRAQHTCNELHRVADMSKMSSVVATQRCCCVHSTINNCSGFINVDLHASAIKQNWTTTSQIVITLCIAGAFIYSAFWLLAQWSFTIEFELCWDIDSCWRHSARNPNVHWKHPPIAASVESRSLCEPLPYVLLLKAALATDKFFSE